MEEARLGLVKGIKYVVGDCSISTKKGIDPSFIQFDNFTNRLLV